MQLKISQAKAMLLTIIKAKLVALISGSPGAGKSALVQQIADEFSLKVIDMRLAQCDPTDLLGFPNVCRETGRASYAPMVTFPLEGDPIPEGYDGWLLFLDEATSCPRAVQAASYKLIYDRMVGEHRLHKNVAIVAAGNLETDGAIVEEMSTALQSRLVHMELVVDHQEWLDWASTKDIDHRICSFIRFKPDSLYTFKPDHTDKTYACPRTWEFANALIRESGGKVDREMLPLLSGTLSEGVAREFVAFCGIYNDLPTMAAIRQNPKGISVPDEPSVLFALTGAIATHMTMESVEQLMEFVNRLPVEFQVVTLRDVTRRNQVTRTHSAIQDWLKTAAVELF